MKRRQLTEEQKAEIIDAYQNQLITMIELGQQYNRSRQTIFKMLKKAGIDTSKRKLPVSCDFCDNTLMRTKGRIRANTHHFCNYTCYYDYLNREHKYIENAHMRRMARRLVNELFPLKDGYIVHHKDRNQGNNLTTNLMVFRTQGDHVRYHRGLKIEPLWDGSC